MKTLLILLALVSSATLSPAADPAPPPSLKKQLTDTPLTGIIIPSLTFDQVTLAEAIAIFNDQVKKQTQGKMEIQWVYKEVDPAKWPHLITLDAKKITAAKLLSEIVTQSKITTKLDQHAIVVRPAGNGAKAPPANTAPPTGKVNAPARDANFGNKSRLNMPPGLEDSSVESSYIDDIYDKTPIKGRNPIKKPN